jgi:hypothetical protein
MRYIFAAFSCLYVFTIGIFSARHRQLINAICRHSGHKISSLFGLVDPILPVIELSQVVGETGPIRILEPLQRDGNMPHLELLAINSLVAYHRPKAIFEIGTFDGRTSLNMAANSPLEGVVYTVDLPVSGIDSTALPLSPFDRAYVDKETPGARIAGQDCASKIIQLSGDSAAFDFSPYLGKMNCVLVDGAHTYEYAMNDSEVARRLLAKNEGIILWHDYGNCDGVTIALNQLYSGEGFWSGLRWIKGTTLACLVLRGNNEGGFK